jgi:hypothetical protein
MRHLSLIYAALIALAALLSGCHRNQESSQGTLELRASSALVGGYETIFYSKSQLLAPNAATFMHISEAEASNLRYPFAYLQGALDNLGSSAHSSMFANSVSVLVGAKDFLPPAGLGSVRSQRCYIVVLGRRSTFDLRKYITSAPVASAAGAPVLSWGAKLGEYGEDDPKTSTLYASQLGQSYVLISNDLQGLEKIAERLGSVNEGVQSTSEIPDWGALSQHDEWAYRKYRHAGIINADAAGMTDVTSSADALVFYFNSDKRTGVFQLIASDKSTAEHINARSTSSKMAWPPLKQIGARKWEATIPFSGDEASAERIFVVVGLFGFPIYL